jgi:hypothetical protein
MSVCIGVRMQELHTFLNMLLDHYALDLAVFYDGHSKRRLARPEKIFTSVQAKKLSWQWSGTSQELKYKCTYICARVWFYFHRKHSNLFL